MTVTRRTLLGGGAALFGGSLLGAGPFGASPARAQDPEAARSLVQTTIDEVLALVTSGGGVAAKVPKLRAIMERRASMPAIARAAAGASWRQMDAGQQEQFVDAFSHYVATIYARRFQEYDGQQMRIDRVRDAGRRGLLVQSSVTNGAGGGVPIIVEWLVSDRSGSLAINDIVIEGVSLVLTQREEIASMLNRRGGNVDRLIDDLASA